jgi:hypothetical protein
MYIGEGVYLLNFWNGEAPSPRDLSEFVISNSAQKFAYNHRKSVAISEQGAT